MFKIVFDLQQEIQSVFAGKSIICDFALLANITLNDVNTRRQGKDQLINKMYDHISAFQMKLGLW
ncbi:unnamed protein product [Lymnaea stagnalis]|uniref:Uncharacterized protein n=1 Tax=Lymnaea stagnalis TaxID=6523 RepID=A0AAV2IPW4_LYMST